MPKQDQKNQTTGSTCCRLQAPPPQGWKLHPFAPLHGHLHAAHAMPALAPKECQCWRPSRPRHEHAHWSHGHRRLSCNNIAEVQRRTEEEQAHRMAAQEAKQARVCACMLESRSSAPELQCLKFQMKFDEGPGCQCMEFFISTLLCLPPPSPSRVLTWAITHLKSAQGHSTVQGATKKSTQPLTSCQHTCTIACQIRRS